LLRQRQVSVGSETAVYYEMHELLRQYAAGRLEEQAESNETKREHGHYYTQLLAEYEPQLLDGTTQASTLKSMQREMDNIRAAWDWALSAKQGDNLNQMLESLYRYYFLPALVSDGQEVMADAAAKLAQCHNKNDSLQLAYGRILGRQGGFVWLLHEDYQTAERLVRHSISILEECAPGIELAQALKTLANIIYTGDLKTARQYWQRSLEIHEQNGHLEGQATLLRNLCVTSPTYSEMLVYWEKALKTAVSANDRRNEGHLYFIRGNGEFRAGHLQIGQELAQKSIDIIRTTDDPPHLILALNVLADIFISKNQIDDARLLLGEMQEIEQHLSIKWHSQLVAIACGRHAVAEKSLEEAENYLTTVLSEISEEGSYKNLRQLAFFYRGRLKLQQGDYVAARNQWQQCCEINNTSDFIISSRRWRALVGIGETYLCEEDGETAVTHFQQAKNIALTIGAQKAWNHEVNRLTEAYPILLLN